MQNDKTDNKQHLDTDPDLAKGNQPNVQNKKDDERVHTVTPDNDSGAPGPPADEQQQDEEKETENK